MGPVFIKFGQIIASSSGVFPDQWVDEFQHCLDRVRPFSIEEVRQVLAKHGMKESSFQKPRADLEELFTAKLPGED